MKKNIFVVLELLSLRFLAKAAYRKESHHVGRYNSHGKGSHYIGGGR